MKTIAQSILILLLVSFSTPQNENKFELFTHIFTKAKNIKTDNFGNLYVITVSNQLYKYGRNGTLLSTLNYNYNGNISSIDVTNPLQLVVLYKELNKVIILDNNLAYRGEIDLTKAGIIQASAAARCYDNNIWVFDMGDLQLKKVNLNSEIEQTSGNIKQYTNNQIAVNFITDNGTNVFALDSINGVLVFDVFGSYKKTIPLINLNELKVLDKYFFYIHDVKLNRYNTQTTLLNKYSLPDTNNILNFSIEKERLYLLKTDTISIYSY